MYFVQYEDASTEMFEHILDAAGAWAAYPSDMECRVLDAHGTEIPRNVLEDLLGYRKSKPAPRIPRSKHNYIY